MTGWDFVSNIVNQFPPLAMTFLSIAAVIICIVGFCKNGVDFFRHGFSQKFLDEILSKLATKEDINELRLATKEDINRLETRMDKVETRMGSMETEMGGMKTELATIKVNHFGHLKDFLTELTSILQDKGIFNNTEKTRLDNKLRGM
jgi:hypothetical protein